MPVISGTQEVEVRGSQCKTDPSKNARSPVPPILGKQPAELAIECAKEANITSLEKQS
jgi:hypothetical protein